MPAQQVVDVDPLSCQHPAPAPSIIEPTVMVIRRRLTSRPACEISGFLVPAITLGGGVRRSRARLVKLSTNALVAPGRKCLPQPCGQDHRTPYHAMRRLPGRGRHVPASVRPLARPVHVRVPRGAVAAARGRCRRSRAGGGPCLSIRMRRNACTPSCRMAASSESCKTMPASRSWVSHCAKASIGGASATLNAATSAGNMNVIVCLERDPGSNTQTW